MFDNLQKPQAIPQSPNAPVQTPVASQAGAVKPPVQPQAQGEEKIYTMPMEYYLGNKTVEAAKSSAPGKPAAQQTSGGNNKKGLTVLIIAILIVVLGGSAYLLVKSFEIPAPAVNIPQPEVNAPAAEPSGVGTTAEQPVAETPVVEAPIAEKLAFDPANISKFSLPLMSVIDTDNDGLTDTEENLIGTKADTQDTDGDKYLDGAEVKNFYSPLDAGSVRLQEKSFVNYYENKKYGYKLIFPTAWLMKPLDITDPKDVMLTSADNEFINIIIDAKQPGQSLAAWYAEKAPNVLSSSLKTYQTFNKVEVIESPDAFTVYMAKDDIMYIVNYNIGIKETASYPAIFQMVINSFEFVPIEKSIPAPLP